MVIAFRCFVKNSIGDCSLNTCTNFFYSSREKTFMKLY